nr:hypothetical protein [Polymorphobacter sp.]
MKARSPILALAAAMFGALAPSSAASAQMIGRADFEASCAEKLPAATCACAANQMQRSEAGRIAVEALAASKLQGNARDAASEAMLNRYDIKQSEAESVTQQAKAYMDQAMRICR